MILISRFPRIVILLSPVCSRHHRSLHPVCHEVSLTPSIASPNCSCQSVTVILRAEFACISQFSLRYEKWLRFVVREFHLHWFCSAKMLEVRRVVTEVKERGGKRAKTVVFSQWTSFLDLLEDDLKRDFRCVRIDGTMDANQRIVAMNAFNSEQRGSPTVMLASLMAAGVGINLLGACNVVVCDPWWNPAVEDQAIDRVYRIGQTEPVTVYRLIVANTVEERMLCLHSWKRQLASCALVMRSPEELKKMKLAEMKQLFGVLPAAAAPIPAPLVLAPPPMQVDQHNASALAGGGTVVGPQESCSPQPSAVTASGGGRSGSFSPFQAAQDRVGAGPGGSNHATSAVGGVRSGSFSPHQAAQHRVGHGPGGSDHATYVLDKSLAPDEECAICLDTFDAGQSVTRLSCLCLYHRQCIEVWWETSNNLASHCPTHLDAVPAVFPVLPGSLLHSPPCF
jgi:hypothetical protein